ncbi:MAG TPA: SDR family NAD(P)-dependent oxidoreductase, partial [Steroidobacteraceae bacterium]|nr:SDR family NAD(P)-dependent oxidoreductase [Steroidobacteraceae bacterium]
MDLQIKDHVVLVSGGAKGIGAAIVRGLAKDGAIPIILDKDANAANSVESELRNSGCTSFTVIGDLTKTESCRAAVEQTLQKFGRLDALVNNAGINDGVGLEKGSPQAFVESLQRNLLHYYNLAHFALPALKKAHGSIVN